MDDVRAELVKNDKGSVMQSIENCMTVLKHDPLLKGAICRNELTCRTDIVKEMGWRRGPFLSLTDVDEYQIQRYMEREYSLKNDRIIRKAISIAASETSYHPIKKFLEGLVWDGQERIRYMATKYLGADEDEYTESVMRLLLLGAINRVYDPGCKYELMIVFVGGQGAGKSTFFRFLSCQDEWFTDDLKNIDDENVYRKMVGKWIIEMSEMLGVSNAKSIESLKAFISRQKDTYKIPYETYPEDRLRQCVFVGTSNNLQFLPFDRTGNRRFVPIKVHPERVEKHILKDEAEARAYFIQVWAEAMEIYRRSEHPELKLTDKMEEYLIELQKEFMPEDINVGVIQEWLDTCGEEYVCSKMIFDRALGYEDRVPKKNEIKDINDIMNISVTGWEPVSSHRFKKGGYGTQRAWKRIAADDEFVDVSHLESPFYQE